MMMKKLTLTDLKKHLAQKSKEELIHEISILYEKFPQVKEYYQIQGSAEDEVVQKYRNLIIEEFTEGKRRPFPKARLSAGKKALSDFKKLTSNPELIVDMILTYVESVSSFNSNYSPDTEDYYTSPEDMFEKALAVMKESNLLAKFKTRARKIVKDAVDGNGNYDSLKERYEEVYGGFRD
jgi:hypothetical protein